MRPICIAAVWLCVLASLAPTVVRAQEDVDNARRHYEAGRSYYEQLRYDDAAREFEEAYRLSGRPHLLKNVAVSHQHAENWDAAVEAFERYLREAPDAEDRAEIEGRTERLRELAADDATEDPELSEADADRDLVSDEAPRAREEDEGGGFPTATVVTLGIGAALGVGAIITGLVSHGIYQDLALDCPGDACDPAREADKDRGETMAVTSTVLTVAAGAAAILAVILFFTVDQDGQDGEEAPEATTVSVAPGPGEAGLSMEVRF